jgi:hypothetical protein
MNTPFEIPFHAADLPCPLPTSAEIENAPDISLDYGGRRVVAVGQHFVVKFGLRVNLIEGENMLFVQGNTDVPLPRVYALYSDPNTGKITLSWSGSSVKRFFRHGRNSQH